MNELLSQTALLCIRLHGLLGERLKRAYPYICIAHSSTVYYLSHHYGLDSLSNVPVVLQGRFSYWVLDGHASLTMLSSKVCQALDLMAVALLKVDEESAFVSFHSLPT